MNGSSHSDPTARPAWPAAPRLTQGGSFTGKAPALSFRSPSGKRAYPRVSLPAVVEIADGVYPIADLSLGGFALDGIGPAAQPEDPFRVTLRVGKRDLSLSIEATVKVRRVEAGMAKSFQFIEISPDAAVALDRLVAIWLSGSESLADSLSRQSLGAPAAARPQARNLRGILVFAAAALALILAVGYVASRRLIVFSEFGAVSAPMSLVRAPQPGLLILHAGASGASTQPGQVLGELRPSLPPQLLAETDTQIQALEGRLRQLQGELAQGEAGFPAFRAQAESELAAAAETRRLLERQAAAQERLFNRLAGLARQGFVSGTRADQEEINLMNQRRSLAEAVAAENAARLLVGEARAGRFRSDGRPTARSPEDVRREAAAVSAALDEARATLARLRAPIPLISPCLCRIAQVVVPSGTAVVAGDVLLGLAEQSGREALEVDALVPSSRMPFLQLGQAASVWLAGADQPTTARIIALNHNPENTGRIGLPDNLRSLRSYGLVTLALERMPPAGVATGLPALVQAPISFRMLLLNLPGFAWLAQLTD